MTNTCLLADRGFLKVSGIDAINFMQGYTTCDLTALADDEPQLGAVCNIQGRMLTSFLVIKRGDDLVLRMHRPLVAKTMEFLKKYIVFSKAELNDISEELVCYGVLAGCADIDIGDGYCLNLVNRHECWLRAGDQLEVASDCTPFLAAEIDAGIAWIQEVTSEEYLPQMFNYHMLDGIDFEKGCYLGQEIVARAQYRGELKRRLHRLSSTQNRIVGDSTGNGKVVAVSHGELLAVIQNSDKSPVTVTFDDGEAVAAIPV